MKENRKIEIEIGNASSLNDALQEILKDIMGTEKKEGKIPVGIVSNQLRLNYLVWKDLKDDFEFELKLQKERLERRMLRELSDLFEDRFHEIGKKREQLWYEIRKELNLSDDLSLNIDTKTGVISQWVETHEREH